MTTEATTKNLDEMTKSELLAQLTQLGIHAPSKATNSTLRDMIVDATPIASSPTDYRGKGKSPARKATDPKPAVVEAADEPVDPKLALAAEKAALEVWRKAKGKAADKPATPLLDAMAAAPKPKGSTKVAAAPKVETPAPKPTAAQVIVSFRIERQALTTVETLTAQGVTAPKVVDRHIVVTKSSAQKLVDAAAAAAADATPTIRDFLAYFVSAIEVQLPEVTDPRANANHKALAALVSGGKPFDVIQHPAGGTAFVVKGETLKARQILSALTPA